MGKNIKSYATIPTLRSPGKGEKPHGKSPSPLAKTKNGLTVHSWVPPSSKFMGKILLFFSKITANHADSVHFTHSPCKLHDIRYKIHTH